MRLLIRADASASTGAGHAVRALSLAESARARGHSVLMAGAVEVGWLAQLLREVVDLVEAPSYDHLARWAADQAVDVLCVDDYRAPADLRVRCARAGLVMVNVEDGTWGRRGADLVVDPSLAADPRPDDGSPTVLRGLEHAPVRAAVRRARRTGVVSRDGHGADLAVLAVMGGTDAAGALPEVLGALVQAQAGVPDIRLRVGAVGLAPGRRVEGLDVHPVVPGADLPSHLAAADLVVAAAGTTMVELCCIGAAMAVVPVTGNQLPGYRAFVEQGLAAGLAAPGGLGPGRAAVPQLVDLLVSPSRRAELAQRAAERVDGAGAARVLHAVEQRLGGSRTLPLGLFARPAARGDASVLRAWRNDPVVRAASRTQGVVDPDEHERWLAAVLESDRRLLYLVDDAAAQAVGSVRWDSSDDPTAWEVSISLAPHARGRGWGAAVLAVGERALTLARPGARLLRASVHLDNDASLRLFAGSGYAPGGPPDAGGFMHLEKTW